MTDTLVVVQAMAMLPLSVLLMYWLLRLEVRRLNRRVADLEAAMNREEHDQ